MPEPVKTNLTVVGSCQSSEIALNQLKLPKVDVPSYGVYTGQILEDISKGQSFTESIRNSIGKEIKTKMESQIPVLSGDEISAEFLKSERINSGVFIHVAGAVKKNEEQTAFKNERVELGNYFEKNNFENISVDTFSQYQEAIKTALNNNQNKDLAIIYFSGHASYLTPEHKEGQALASVTLPDFGNQPDREGVFYFSGKNEVVGLNDFEKVNPIHEAAIMGEIKKLVESGNYKQVIAVFDTCNAGAFDAEQFVKEAPSEIPKVDLDRIYIPRR